MLGGRRAGRKHGVGFVLGGSGVVRIARMKPFLGYGRVSECPGSERSGREKDWA